MGNHLRKYALYVLLVLVLLLQSCGLPGAEQPTPEPVKLKVGIMPFLGFVPFFIAEEEGYYAEQALSREEALRGYTTGPAYAAFLEDEVGSIEVGKFADLTVFDRDILTIEPSEILETRVAYTIVDGRIVFEAGQR